MSIAHVKTIRINIASTIHAVPVSFGVLTRDLFSWYLLFFQQDLLLFADIFYFLKTIGSSLSGVRKNAHVRTHTKYLSLSLSLSLSLFSNKIPNTSRLL
jgi:hypothetical protein